MILASQSSYGHTRYWCTPFEKVVVSVFGCEEIEDARHASEAIARMMGWTPARWWQAWRWDEAERCRELERYQSEKTAFQRTGSFAYAISIQDHDGPTTRTDMSCQSLETAVMDTLTFVQIREAARTPKRRQSSLEAEA